MQRDPNVSFLTGTFVNTIRQPHRKLTLPAFGAILLPAKNYQANFIEIQNTGREGLAGPSELGLYPQGQPRITTTIGGGYSFVPPIPNKKICEITEQFFY